MKVEKYWSELLMVMCEDEHGHVRPTEENALMKLSVEEFFIKLLVFKERLDKRIKQSQDVNNKP